MNANHISREGIKFIAQELELIRGYCRMNRVDKIFEVCKIIENRIQEELLNRRQEDLQKGEKNGINN